MKDQALPILYSFRRCPYAMRARLAIASSQVAVELREVVLRDKPDEMLEASAKGTVPVLRLVNGAVIDESLDVIEWALDNADPEGWLDYPSDTIAEMYELVASCDGGFKEALDRYKYPNRYEVSDATVFRDKGAVFIKLLEGRLSRHPYLFGERFSFGDAVTLPFIRQFAHVDRDWFWAQDWPFVIGWLEEFLESGRFQDIMEKYPQWKSGEPGVRFGA